MANWFQQMFTPTGLPPQRMDQGGGEYTGYIPGVYEGDDSMPNPIATTGEGQTARDYQLDAQRKLLAREKKQLEDARRAEGNTQPGAGAVQAPGVTLAPEVTNPKYQDNAPYVGPQAVVSGPTTSVGSNEGVITSQPGGSGGSILDSMFGPGNPVDQGVRALQGSTIIGDAVDRAVNQGGGNVINDAFTWLQTSPKVGNVLDPVFQGLDKVSEVSGRTGFDRNPINKWVVDAQNFDFGGADYSGMGKQLVTDAKSIVSSIAGAVRDATGGMSMPTVVESDPARDAASSGIGAGDSIQEKAMSVLRPAGALAKEAVTQTGNYMPTRGWDIFFNSLPFLDQRGQSNNTITRPTDISPTMEGQVGPPAEFETVDQQQARVNAASGPQIFDRRRIKPSWMRWFTPDSLESGSLYDDMTEEERRANLLARIAAGDNSMVTTRR